MISTRYNRRVVLRGAGVSIALPFFYSWMPAFARPAAPAPMRILFMYAPNGKHMADWTPPYAGELGVLPRTLQPLAAFKDNVSILSGLAQRNADAKGDGPGDHARAMATFLTGCRPHKTSGTDVRVGVSIDQLLAASIGRDNRFPSLEVGCEGGSPGGTCDNGYSCAYQTNLSWRSPSTPMPKETDPRLLFERLFGDRLRPVDENVRGRRERERRSVLDFVAEETSQLTRQLDQGDRRKLDEYLTSLREVERRLQQAGPVLDIGREKLRSPAGTPANFEKHAQLLADLVTLALQSDLTRVVTFVLGNDGSNRSYREAGVSEGHHDVSHHGNDPSRLEKLRRINRLHIGQLAYLLGKLQACATDGKTLLDQCLVVYGSGISDGDRHNHDNLPIVLAGAGGRFHRGGRHVRYGDGTPLCNLYLSMLKTVGNGAARFGDSSGALALPSS